MNVPQRLAVVVVLVGALAGCGGDDSADAGPDAGLVDLGGTDAGTDEGVDAGRDLGFPDLGDPGVVRCTTAAAAFMADCPGDGARTCQAGAYGTFCQIGADPVHFADAIACLAAMSSASGGCRTFSDPSGAAACVDAVYAGVTNGDVEAVVTRVDTLCAPPAVNPLRTEPPLFALSPAQLSTLKGCVEAAAACADVAACTDTSAGAIAACYTTPTP